MIALLVSVAATTSLTESEIRYIEFAAEQMREFNRSLAVLVFFVMLSMIAPVVVGMLAAKKVTPPKRKERWWVDP